MPQPNRSRLLTFSLIFLLVTLGTAVYSRTVFQIVPTLTISEEYRDNYFNTSANKQEEWITSYALGFSMGILEEKHTLYLSYSPQYEDYKNLDDRDRVRHYISVDGEFNPTRHTSLALSARYDGDSDNNEGETRSHEATLSTVSQLTKNTRFTHRYDYTDSFDEQVRTGEYKEHTIHTNEFGLSNQFGKDNHLRVTFLYEFDEYDTADDDAYTRYRPAGFIGYRFSQEHRMDANLSYQDKDFDDTDEYTDTIAGDIRFIKSFNKKVDGFVKYRHSYSDTDEYTHHVFHPSVGFDWEVTEDSGISLGAGVLFHEWSNDNDEDPDPFLDLNAYKTWDFSRRGRLALTAASGYSDSSDDASSLGYNIFYQAGARLDYQLARQVSSNIFASYRLNEYEEDAVDRTDKNLVIGTGLSWQPLKWLILNFNYTFTDYDTSTAEREDYRDNRVLISVELVPETPIRIDYATSRQSFEKSVYLER